MNPPGTCSPTVPMRWFHSTYLVCHLSLAFIIGLTAAHYLPALNRYWLWSGCLLLAVASIAATISNLRWRSALLLALVLLFGIFRGQTALNPALAPNHIIHLTKNSEETTIVATLLRAPACNQQRCRLLLDVQAQLEPGSAHRLTNLQQRPVSGRLKLSCPAIPPDLQPGDTILALTSLSKPRGFNNPGSYQPAAQLALDRVYVQGWLSHPDKILIFPPLANRSLLHHLRFGPERVRYRVIKFINQQLPAQQASLYRALLTGDRSGLSATSREAFVRVGIYHMLAISGLHMAMLAAGLHLVVITLLRCWPTLLLTFDHERLAAAISFVPLLLYGFVSGFQPPALRAFIMISLYLFCRWQRQSWHPLTTISLAALLILASQPLELFHPSFQLSFAAVLGIALILPRLSTIIQQEHGGRVRAWVLGSIAVSLAASLATLPLILFHFQRTSLIGLFTTLLFEPLLCIWSLGLGLLALPCIFIWPAMANVLLQAGAFGLQITASLVEPLAQLPWASAWHGPPGLAQIFLCYLGLLLLACAPSNSWRFAGLGLFLLLFVEVEKTGASNRLTILDVGKGNCTLIELTDGSTILVDGGGPSSTTFDIGRQVIAPFLRQHHVSKLDLVIASHADNDHYSGLPSILTNFHCGQLWLPETNTKQFRSLLKAARDNKTKVIIPQPGSSFPPENPQGVTLLSNLHLSAPTLDDNEQSLVISVQLGAYRLLLPGDIGILGENALLANLAQHQVVVAPHHGSATSSSAAFIKAASPDYVVFSCSPYSKDLFPAKQVKNRYQQQGTRLLSTAQSGAIRFQLEDQELTVHTFDPASQTFRPLPADF